MRTDFIDIYAEIDESERDQILRELEDREETIMIKQVLKEEGRKEGRVEGHQEGHQEGLQEGHFNMLSRVMLKKYQRPHFDIKALKGLSPEDQLELLDFMLDCDSFTEIEEWIRRRKSGNMT